MDEATSVKDILIGGLLTKDEAQEITNLLRKDTNLQELLADAQMRSEQHRENYTRLKTQHGKVLHQLKVMESELSKVENEKLELESELRCVIEKAVEEGRLLRGEMVAMEANTITEERRKEIENRAREEVEEEWKNKLLSSVEESENLSEMMALLQQENASLRASFKNGVTDVEQNMQEVILKFESKISQLEKEKQAFLESPNKIENENHVLQKENTVLRNKIRNLTNCMEEYEAETRRQNKQMSEIESSNIKLESDLKMRLKHAETKCIGLEKQLANIMNELTRKDASLNDMNQKLKSLQKEFDLCKIELEEKQRICDMKIGDFEMNKAKEFSGLKREISLSRQKIQDNQKIIESQSKELSEIKERQSIVIQKCEEELMESKAGFQDTIQQYEDRQAELGLKIKTLGLTIQDFQEEKDLYKEERTNMLKDFDEDMRRISFENSSMKNEIKFLRDDLDRVLQEKKNVEQLSADREKELTNDLKTIENKMIAMKGRLLDQNEKEDEKTSELSKKCRKYNKLIHKLRDKLALIQADSERIQMEKDAMVGYISPESHSNVKKQLMDLQQKQKEFANVFSHMEDCEKINNEKQEKIALMNDVAETLNELKAESKEFLEEIESEKYSISFEIDEQISKGEDSDTKDSGHSRYVENVS